VSVEMEARDDDRPGSPRDCRLRLRRRVPGPCAAGPPGQGERRGAGRARRLPVRRWGSRPTASSWAWSSGCCRAGFRTCPTSRSTTAGCACSSSCSGASSNASPAGLTQAAPGSPTGRWSASPTTLAARRAAASLAPLATATPSRSTATSTAFGSCSSPTGAGSRSATISRDRTASAVCSSRADPARAT
jgi:hypothetical protein